MLPVQVNFCQKRLFSHQLTQNMAKDCTLIYQFNTWKLQAQNMGRTCCVQKLFWTLKQKTNLCAQHVLPCSELVVFMYWTGKSMNNLLSYCGLVDVRINASDKDLPVQTRNTCPIWIHHNLIFAIRLLFNLVEITNSNLVMFLIKKAFILGLLWWLLEPDIVLIVQTLPEPFW